MRRREEGDGLCGALGARSFAARCVDLDRTGYTIRGAEAASSWHMHHGFNRNSLKKKIRFKDEILKNFKPVASAGHSERGQALLCRALS